MSARGSTGVVGSPHRGTRAPPLASCWNLPSCSTGSPRSERRSASPCCPPAPVRLSGSSTRCGQAGSWDCWRTETSSATALRLSFSVRRRRAPPARLFDVPDALLLRFGILGIHGQPDSDLERRRIGHAALLALLHVVLDRKSVV